MEIKDTLKALMEKRLIRGKPITCNALAVATKIPQVTMWNILNGVSKDPRTRLLQKLADYFGVTVEYLRTGGTIGAPPVVAAPQPGRDNGDEVKHLSYVSMDELEMLTAYRSSNEIGRRAIYAALKAIADESPAKQGNIRGIKR